MGEIREEEEDARGIREGGRSSCRVASWHSPTTLFSPSLKCSRQIPLDKHFPEFIINFLQMVHPSSGPGAICLAGVTVGVTTGVMVGVTAAGTHREGIRKMRGNSLGL